MQILTGQGFETSGGVEVFGAHPYENDTMLSRICFVKESQRWFKVRHALAAASLLYPKGRRLRGWWPSMGRFIADQSTFTLLAGYPLALAVLVAGVGYLTIRRATP